MTENSIELTGSGAETEPYIVGTWAELQAAIAVDGSYVEVVPNTVFDMQEIFPNSIITVPVLDIHCKQFNGNGMVMKNLYGEITAGNSKTPVIKASRSVATTDLNYISGIKLINYEITNTAKSVPLIGTYITGNTSQNTAPYYVWTDMEYRGLMFAKGLYRFDSEYDNYGKHFKSKFYGQFVITDAVTTSWGVTMGQKWDTCFLHIDVNGRIQPGDIQYLMNSYLEGSCQDNTDNTYARILNIGNCVCSVFNVNVDSNGFSRNNQIKSASNVLCCLINDDKVNVNNNNWNVGSEVHRLDDTKMKTYATLKSLGFPIIQEVSP